MYSWNTSLLLAAPREKVWSTLVDFTNLHTWNPKVASAQLETDGELGQGTRIRLGSGSGSTVLTIEEWGPPRLLRMYLTRGRTTGSSRYYLTNAADGKTQLEHVLELDPPFYLEPLMLFAGSSMRRELAALKRHVEQRST